MRETFVISFLALLILGAFVIPVARTWSRTGILPIPGLLRRTAPQVGPESFIETQTALFLALVVIDAGLFLVMPCAYEFLGPIAALDRPGLHLAGGIVATLSLAGMIAAQTNLGTSWRIGIDDATPGPLVSAGLYGLCRNPIFLCLFGSLAGFFLLLANTLTLVLAVCSWVVVNIQVRLEEQFLLGEYGADYAAYAARVGRFTPWTGRLGLEVRADAGTGEGPQRPT